MRTWTQTYTGRKVYPLALEPEEVCIEDIAHALAHKCRYNGHCLRYYSVAEHSVLVSSILPPELRLWGLLHDAGEAYLADVPRPVKPKLHGFEVLESKVLQAVAQRFDLPWPMPEDVNLADNAVLAAERDSGLIRNPWQWEEVLPESAPVIIAGLSPVNAKSLFMNIYRGINRFWPGRRQ